MHIEDDNLTNQCQPFLMMNNKVAGNAKQKNTFNFWYVSL